MENADTLVNVPKFFAGTALQKLWGGFVAHPIQDLCTRNSVVAEVKVIQVYGIRLLLVVSIHLVIDRHAVPSGWCWIVIPVQGAELAVQCNGFED
jgi:hypothetical protein